MKLEVIVVDYLNKQQGIDLISLLDSYSQDPLGNNKALPNVVKNRLVNELAKLSNAFSLICYADNKPAGLLNFFEGFSTFKCQPLINIHDVIILKEFRGHGISQLMLKKVEEIALDKGCCKLTLEVLEGNVIARKAYAKYGFSGYELDPLMGKALFWEKPLNK